MSHIKKGDTVLVLNGDDRGKEGVVLKIDRKKSRAIVEGVHFVKRHVRPTQKSPQGGVIEKESSIHLSNLQPIGK